MEAENLKLSWALALVPATMTSTPSKSDYHHEPPQFTLLKKKKVPRLALYDLGGDHCLIGEATIIFRFTNKMWLHGESPKLLTALSLFLAKINIGSFL